ncbi:MAG: YbgA family protein, partial [Chloroflexota bacterium]|nr:YbgA family protein [Chloroflexota bacterium]
DALARPPRRNSGINVLMHALGYFSEGLSNREKAFFLDALGRYRAGKVPLSVPIGIVSSWIVRFNEPYLVQQTFFESYPEDLLEITDSGKGRVL